MLRSSLPKTGKGIIRSVGTHESYLAGNERLAEVLCHQAVLEVAVASTPVVSGQEHVPQPEFLGFGFEVIQHLGVC